MQALVLGVRVRPGGATHYTARWSITRRILPVDRSMVPGSEGENHNDPRECHQVPPLPRPACDRRRNDRLHGLCRVLLVRRGDESSEALIVRYTPSDPDLEVRSFTVEPRQSGQGLGARLSAYRAGSITVLTTGCSPFGTVPLDREKIDLRISPPLSVERLGDDDVPALAKSTYLDELSGDAACDQANPTPTG